MPLFKITVLETVEHTLVAYVEAPDARAADRWASQIDDFAGAGQAEPMQDRFASETGVVTGIDPVAVVPPGCKVNQVPA